MTSTLPDTPVFFVPPPLPEGTPFGDGFRILGLLGRGGMGSVYLAEDVALHRRFALKVLDRASSDGERLERFFREARIMAGLHHPNIAEVHHFGTDAATGFAYFTMDPFPKTLADDLVEGRTLDESRVAALGLQLLSALEALHGHSPRILHRDVKPSNLLLADDGTLRLSDFGIAKEQASMRDFTLTGTQPGSWDYAAPEQRADRPATPATDYYAFGVVLYRALTGGFPPPSAALPIDVAPRISRRWRSLLRALLAANPDVRLQNPQRIRRALLGIQRFPVAFQRRAVWAFFGIVLASVLIVVAVPAWQRHMKRVRLRRELRKLEAALPAQTLPPAEPASPEPGKPSKARSERAYPDYQLDPPELDFPQKRTEPESVYPPMPKLPEPTYRSMDLGPYWEIREGKRVVASGVLSGPDVVPGSVLTLDGGTLILHACQKDWDYDARYLEYIGHGADAGWSPPEENPSYTAFFPYDIQVTSRGGTISAPHGISHVIFTNRISAVDAPEGASLRLRIGNGKFNIRKSTLDGALTLSPDAGLARKETPFQWIFSTTDEKKEVSPATPVAAPSSSIPLLPVDTTIGGRRVRVVDPQQP